MENQSPVPPTRQSQIESQLLEFARTAAVHAQQEHAVQVLTLAEVDKILEHQRARGDSSSYESLALVYGAWVGYWMIENLPELASRPSRPRIPTSQDLCYGKLSSRESRQPPRLFDLPCSIVGNVSKTSDNHWEVRQVNADQLRVCWSGLLEPVPPRIQVYWQGFPGSHHRRCYSPIDAVRRRLQSERSPGLAELLETAANQLALPRNTAEKIEQHNLLTWENLSQDPRFANPGMLPETPSEALEAIDPWLREELLRHRHRTACIQLDSAHPSSAQPSSAQPSSAHPKLLCLAAGGGTHAPLHALAGFSVTVVDISDRLLQLDRDVADRLGLKINAVTASMTDLSELDRNQFDVVLQPVSTNYVLSAADVYLQVARVIRHQGLYVVQHKNPVGLQVCFDESRHAYRFLDRLGAANVAAISEDSESSCESESAADSAARPSFRGVTNETDAIETPHSLHELIGELCRTGFVIEDFVEPEREDEWAPTGSMEHFSAWVPPYFKLKARFAQTNEFHHD